MADITKRLHYFNGQFLEEKDFSDEQEYHLDRMRRHNRLLHTSGIAEGLTVTGVVGAGDITVGVGTALDNQGRMIVLGSGESLSLNSFPNKTVLVVISYDETGTDPATVGNQGQATRWEEKPKVQLVDESAAPSEGTHIRLARVEVSGDRTVSTLDTSVRRAAGVRVGGELAIPRLQISSEQRPDEDWPELTSDAERRVLLEDHLAVSGNLTAGAISTTGSLTAGGITASGVTASGAVSAASVTATGAVTGGSLTTAGNVSAAGITASGTLSGANINTAGTLNAGNITTAGNLSAGTITTTGTVTAGSITTSGTLAARSITATDSLSFPSLDLSGNLTVNGTITGNLAADSIQAIHVADAAITTDKLADYAVTTNEIDFHAVNNAKIAFGAVSLDRLDDQAQALLVGALPESKYELRQRSFVVVEFADPQDNGATQPITLGYRPQMIFVSGYILAVMNGGWQGGLTSGFVDGVASQVASGPFIQRMGGPPYFVNTGINSNASCARGYFIDNSVSPSRQLNLEVVVDSITSTGLVVRLIRTHIGGVHLPLDDFQLRLNLFCLGT